MFSETELRRSFRKMIHTMILEVTDIQHSHFYESVKAHHHKDEWAFTSKMFFKEFWMESICNKLAFIFRLPTESEIKGYIVGIQPISCELAELQKAKNFLAKARMKNEIDFEENEYVFVAHIYVSDGNSHSHQKIGKRLYSNFFHEVKERFKKVVVEIPDVKQASIEFHESIGFKKILDRVIEDKKGNHHVYNYYCLDLEKIKWKQ